MKKVSFCTLGCKVNQYETEAMSEMFAQNGYEICDFEDVCDVYVINTCTVTNMGDRKSRQMIRRAKHKNNNAVIAVVGCYSQIAPDEIKEIDGVNVVLGTKDRVKVVEMVEKSLSKNTDSINVSNVLKNKIYENIGIENYTDKTRAFVKIEDGCSEFCTYCIIPYARGPVRSREVDNIIDEINRLCQNGFTEVVLTGIHVASYGKDLENTTLLDLIKKVAKTEIKRIRLGSIEPRLLSEDFIREISNIEKICPHFHISLQSGCDETLKRMRRKYTCDEYRNSVNLLRKYYDKPSITTDIMVGFPGETQDEFECSLNFAKEIGFSEVHIFQYSRRKGTIADKMPNQVPSDVKAKRSKLMAECTKMCADKYLKSFIGEKIEVLFEQQIDGFIEGTAKNYIKVRVKTDRDIFSKYITCKITQACDGFVIGQICD